ncbi:MAG: DUF2752 domain-containing protein [Planctomycetes bacterium]|nr:DUF2752 domain-containing protein [Planctomycetota bacterium]
MQDNSQARLRPLSGGARWLLAVWTFLLAAGFVMARCLEPDPRGFGTHERLGLPACRFETVVGMPCPSCGLTTSFAHAVRGRLFDAARSHPAGLFLAAVCAVLVPWAACCAVTGRLWWIERPDRALVAIAVGFCFVAGLSWCLRIVE